MKKVLGALCLVAVLAVAAGCESEGSALPEGSGSDAAVAPDGASPADDVTVAGPDVVAPPADVPVATADLVSPPPSDASVPQPDVETPPPADVASGADTPSTPIEGVGAPCVADADCGVGGTCILESQGLPGGYCTQAECDTTPCPEGSECFEFQSGANYCLRTCATDADCPRDGYICDADSTCWEGTPELPPGHIGAACAADTDCPDEGAECYPETSEGEPTGFADGYCVLFGCSEEKPCPGGAECYSLSGGDTVCLDTCATRDDCRDGYACQPPGACLPACTPDSCEAGEVCGSEGLCEPEPCTADSCPTGQVCVEERCVPDVGPGPGPGPGPDCPNLPPLECEGTAAHCGEVVPFDPDEGDGWWDYPLNGETAGNQYRSFLRRDAMMRIQYAAAKVACKAAAWEFGNGGRVGLGDMSEANGAIPGTSVGEPGHPEGTHTNGFDIDVGYYQVNTPDNKLRAICEHTSGGQEAYHCTAAPHLLDPWRSALFVGALFESPNTRVIGCDGKVGPMLEAALDTLCGAGWISTQACRRVALAFEETEQGYGWYYFHHHHMHVSADLPTYAKALRPLDRCLVPGCGEVPLRRFLARQGIVGPGAKIRR